MKILIRYAVDYRVNSTWTPSHDEIICSVNYSSTAGWYYSDVEFCYRLPVGSFSRHLTL